jgi:hypothetical protein
VRVAGGPKTTLDRYGHIVPERESLIADTFDRAVQFLLAIGP